jgi:hypothetical protein
VERSERGGTSDWVSAALLIADQVLTVLAVRDNILPSSHRRRLTMQTSAEGPGGVVRFTRLPSTPPAFCWPLLALAVLIPPTTAQAAEAAIVWCQANLGVMEVAAVGRSGGAPGITAGNDCGQALAALLGAGFQLRNVSAGVTLHSSRASVTYSLTR